MITRSNPWTTQGDFEFQVLDPYDFVHPSSNDPTSPAPRRDVQSLNDLISLSE